MGPGPASRGRSSRQVRSPRRRRSRCPARTQRRRQPRKRKCLLKGCEQPFVPRHPLARYCGDACRRAAARWSRRKYRRTDRGKEVRQKQSQRHRTLKKAVKREGSRAGHAGSGAGVGHRSRVPDGFFAVTGQGVTSPTLGRVGRRGSGSVAQAAVRRCGGCRSGNGDGNSGGSVAVRRRRSRCVGADS